MLKQLIKEILKEELTSEVSKPESKYDQVMPFIGKPVLIRHNKMGVNTGILESHDSENYYLKDSRKLWRWAPKKSIALESFAVNGPDKERTRATEIVEMVAIPKTNDMCGVILLTQDIFKMIQDLEATEQS